jgi:hypothetical protein
MKSRSLSLLAALSLLLPAAAFFAQQTDEQILLHGGSLHKNRYTQSPTYDEEVRPSATDPNIRTFDNPHGVYFPAGKIQRNQLLLFITGTQPAEKKGAPQKPGARRFCKNAALSGYHVIFLMYPNDISAADACRKSQDREAYSIFRWAIIEGGNTSFINIPRSESIENRTIKLLEYLQNEHPSQNWGQFVHSGQISWEKVAVAGQSQGGGHAAIIATRFLVSRVICFGAPKDFSLYFREPAKWYESSVTPLSRYFAFNNYQDKQGCDYEQLLQNIKKLGIDKGGVADVDKEVRPFHHAHALFTDWPGTPTDSKTAHGSMISDANLNGKGVPIFRPVWWYMLNSSIDGITQPNNDAPVEP